MLTYYMYKRSYDLIYYFRGGKSNMTTRSREAKMSAFRKEISRLEKRRDELMRAKETSGDDVDQSAMLELYTVLDALASAHQKLEILKNQADDGDMVVEGAITIGSKVKILMAEDDGETEELSGTIVPVSNGNNGEISDSSPIGKAILGKCKGDRALCKVPDGMLTLTILSVE